jgi:hypothetical protein
VTARIAVGVVVVMVLAGGLAFWNPWHLVVVDRVLMLPGIAVVSAIVFGCRSCCTGRSSTDRAFTCGPGVVSARG